MNKGEADHFYFIMKRIFSNLGRATRFFLGHRLLIGVVILFGLSTSNGHCDMIGHEGFVNSLQVDNRGPVLVSASWDTSIRT